MCQPVAENSSRRHLHSAARGDLAVPVTRAVRCGPRSFAVAGPSTWNSLPAPLRHCQFPSSFRRELKQNYLPEHITSTPVTVHNSKGVFTATKMKLNKLTNGRAVMRNLTYFCCWCARCGWTYRVQGPALIASTHLTNAHWSVRQKLSFHFSSFYFCHFEHTLSGQTLTSSIHRHSSVSRTHDCWCCVSYNFANFIVIKLVHIRLILHVNSSSSTLTAVIVSYSITLSAHASACRTCHYMSLSAVLSSAADETSYASAFQRT